MDVKLARSGNELDATEILAKIGRSSLASAA